LESHKDFELISICDTDTDKELNCQYTDYQDMLQSEDIDCVFVCVPHTLTTGITVNCLHSGLDVFAEKPPGLSLSDIELMENAKHKENILQFGFNHRYYQHVQFLYQVIKSDRFGKLLWLRGQYGRTRNEGWRLKKELGGQGIFISQGLHMLDLVLWLSGHYDRINIFKLKGSIVSSYKHSSWFEDNVFVLLESHGGVSASIHSSCTMSKNSFNLWVQFEKGWVELCGVNTSTKSFDYPERVVCGSTNDDLYYGNPPSTEVRYEHDVSWNVEIDNFADNIKNRFLQYPCSITEARSLMSLVEEIYEKGV